MHICFIEDTHLHGGTQIWVTEAFRFCAARGHQVTLLTPAGGWVAQQVTASQARLVDYDWEGIVETDAVHQARWIDALAGSDVAICTVHPPRGGFHCAQFAAECIKEAGLRTHLVTKTGTIVPTYRREFYLPDESIDSSVIAIAAFTRRALIDRYRIPANLVTLIYHGTDLERFRPTPEGRDEALARYPLPPDASPVLCCVGSFEMRKGQGVLIDAVAQLATGPLPQIHLMLVGDGPAEEALRTQVRTMSLEAHVTFFSFTDAPQLVFQRADITVLPSLYQEGLPNVLLESMAAQTPVIASEFGGIPEVVRPGETGYLTAPGNRDQLTQAIPELWADLPTYHQLATNGRRLMEADFDKVRQFDLYLDYLQGKALCGP